MEKYLVTRAPTTEREAGREPESKQDGRTKRERSGMLSFGQRSVEVFRYIALLQENFHPEHIFLFAALFVRVFSRYKN